MNETLFVLISFVTYQFQTHWLQPPKMSTSVIISSPENKQKSINNIIRTSHSNFNWDDLKTVVNSNIKCMINLSPLDAFAVILRFHFFEFSPSVPIYAFLIFIHSFITYKVIYSYFVRWKRGLFLLNLVFSTKIKYIIYFI